MGGYEPQQMNEKGQITSVNRSEKTVIGAAGKVVETPYFDAAAIEKAQPAVPLKEIRATRSWPRATLLTIAIASGLAGGVIGGLLPTLFLKDNASTQTAAPQHASAETTIAEEDTPSSVPSVATDNHEQRLSESPEEVGDTSGAKSVAEEPTDAGDTSQRGVPKDLEASLRGALNDWVAATNARDIDRQMIFYNPVVEAFYRSRNASSADVRRDKARVFERASSIDIRAGAPDIRLSPDGRTAIMRFHKRYEIVGGGVDRRGEVVQELRWQRIKGEWRIISERDLRVVR
jgi:ketosteroid isomerase-like protein